MENEVRIPDVEILITASAFDVAFVAFYANEDIHEGYDVVCGVNSKNEVEHYVALLQDAITALRSVDWVSLDQLGASAVQNSADEPF